MISGTLSHESIRSRIPHQGPMCLLDQVLVWDETHIICSAVSHRDRNNPLRTGNSLPAICGIEYAAQAMALHASLTEISNKHGLLAGVRDVALFAENLDDIPGKLTVRVEKIVAEGEKALYQFDILAGDRELLRGRLAAAFTIYRP
ncbi:MAG: hydroxymyristoyl-ACP dehydratase [Burkholderiales bacterium]